MSNNESWGEDNLRPLWEGKCKLPHKSHKICIGGCADGICRRDNQPLWEESDEKRMEQVFQNGNDGTHYPKLPQASWRDHFARHGGKLANTRDKC